MSAPARLAAFAVGLLVVFAAGFGLGAAVGADATDDEPAPTITTAPTTGSDHDDHGTAP